MRDPLRYERIVLDRYQFRGLHGCDSWCGLEIMRLPDERTVVIATEVVDNRGTSVTNAFEQLAYAVCCEFAIHPAQLVWIEHYGYPSPVNSKRPRTYDLVRFGIVPAGPGKLFADPKWRPMRKEDWLGLGLQPREPGP